MNWLEVALVGAVLVGAAAGTAIVVRNPSFWWGLVLAVLKAALPLIVKRNPPEIEAKMRECIRRGGEWDNFNKLCRYK